MGKYRRSIGTLFITPEGVYHSSRDLGILELTVEVVPAAPKTNYINIPGTDGSRDQTEALGVGVKYEDRTIKWTFALYPGDHWYETQGEVSNALNGRTAKIILDDDPGWYYDGRITVENHKSDKLLRQITVSARCRPYKLRHRRSELIDDRLSVDEKPIALTIGAMPQMPTITVTEETELRWPAKNLTVLLPEGTHRIPELFMHGQQLLTVRAPGGTGSIKFSWQEGSL